MAVLRLGMGGRGEGVRIGRGAGIGRRRGFLAVFAAGLALRRIERLADEAAPEPDHDPVDDARLATEEAATAPETAPAYLAKALLGFNEQLERIAEVVVVIIVGALLAAGVPYVEHGTGWARFFGFVGIILASVNIFGGFLVTQRMLGMYKKKA